MPNLIASGSDDCSIRIWDLNQVGCSSIQVLGGQGAHSHTMNVRGLAFLPEITWCLLSGSWDSTIKVWDIRTGACMLTVTDHNSDVYGICFQYNRPFVFTSCSRDTTIRHFCIDGLVQQLKLKLMCGKEAVIDNSEVIDSPEATHMLRGKYKLCSPKASKLVSSASMAQPENSFFYDLSMFDFLYQQEG